MTHKIVIIAGATSMIGTACSKLLSQNESIKLILLGRDQEMLENLAQRTPPGDTHHRRRNLYWTISTK